MADNMAITIIITLLTLTFDYFMGNILFYDEDPDSGAALMAIVSSLTEFAMALVGVFCCR